MGKKRYTTPAMRIVPVLAEQSLLSSSFVGIGGDTDHFDTQKKEEGCEWASRAATGTNRTAIGLAARINIIRGWAKLVHPLYFAP